jgi:ferredoxin-NADP reductase/hemoglobin-like flavoprotein
MPLVQVPQHAAPPPPLDIWAVEQSLAAVSAGAQKLAGAFYGYLFAACPELRELFPGGMTNQNERLFAALVKIVGMLGQPDRLERYLIQLGADHRKYGVQPEMYAPVGNALLRTLRQYSEGWGDRAEAAWAGAYTALADSMIAGAEIAPGPPWWRGQVLRHEMRAKDLAILDIRTHEPFPYEPGQYLTLQHPKWSKVWRQFSIASPPDQDGDRVQLHVRQVTGGWVSTALTRDTPDGGEVLLGPAVGTMTAEAANGRDLLLVAGGVGLAPMEALARDILSRDEIALAGGWGLRRNVTLFHGARTALGLYDAHDLHELEKSYPWFQMVPVVSDDQNFTGLRGSVAEAALSYGDWMNREAYLAGPAAMITDAARGLRAAGVPEDRVHYDEAAAR